MQQRVTGQNTSQKGCCLALAALLVLVPWVAWAGLVPMSQSANADKGPIPLAAMQPVSLTLAVSPLATLAASQEASSNPTALVSMVASGTVVPARPLQTMQENMSQSSSPLTALAPAAALAAPVLLTMEQPPRVLALPLLAMAPRDLASAKTTGLLAMVTTVAKPSVLMAMGAGANTPAKPGTLVALATPVAPLQNTLLTTMATSRPVLGSGLMAMVSATPARIAWQAALQPLAQGPTVVEAPSEVVNKLGFAPPLVLFAATTGGQRGWAPVVSLGSGAIPTQLSAAQQTLASPLAAVSSLPGLPTPTAWATGLAGAPAAENEMLLVYLLDNQPMGEEGALLSAREGADGRVYLPLQTVAASLGFPIEVNAPAGIARGWFIQEGRTFELDMARKVVRIGGVEQPLPADAIQSEGSELFVVAEVMNTWFPVKFRVEATELALYASSTEPLPLATRLARQRLWASRERGPGLASAPRHLLDSPQFGWPDLRLNYGLTGGNRLGELASNYGVQGRGVLLGMESFLNLGFADGGYGDQGLTTASFRMMQRSPSNTLGEAWLGSLAGRTLELGDVTLPYMPLLINRTTGAGVAFSNAPDNFVSGLNDFVLQSEAPVGWDVEVYRNGGLSTFATVGTDGRYRFTNLQLSSGMNDFRIVLYGPQGQREERLQSFRVGPGLVGSGELVYQVGALVSSAPVIRTAGAAQPQGGSTVVLNTAYGLTDKLAITAGLAGGPLGSVNEPTAGANVGLRASLGNSFHQADYAILADGSMGYSARSSVRLLDDIDLGAFITRQASGTLNLAQAERTYGVDFADTVRLGNTALRYGLAYTETRYGSQPRIERLQATQGWQLGRVNLNNTMGLRRIEGKVEPEAGKLEFATRMAGLPLRGGVDYQLQGDEIITAVGLGTQVRLGSDENTVLSLAGNVQPAAGQGSVNAGLQRSLGPLTLALNSSYNSNQTFQAGVNLGVALASAGDRPSWKLTDARTEGFGYASADILIFVDENNNGVRDADEAVVPDVKLVNLRSANTQLTNREGVARFGDLLPNTEVGVQIEEESLPDLYLRPRDGTHVLQTRTGYGGTVQLPLQRLGELGGQVAGVAAANYREVTLWLADAGGSEVQRVGTDDTGNFNFQPVPLGHYILNAQQQGGAVVSIPVVLSKAAQVMDDLTVRLPSLK